MKYPNSPLDIYQALQKQRARIIEKYGIENPDARAEERNQFAVTIHRTVLRQFKQKITEPLRTILACRNPDLMDAALEILRSSQIDIGGNEQQRQVGSNLNYN